MRTTNDQDYLVAFISLRVLKGYSDVQTGNFTTKTRRRAKEDEEEALTSSNAGRIADDYGTTTKDIEGNSFSLLPAFFVSSCLRGDIFAVHVGYLCSPWFKGSLDIARQKKGVIHG